MAKAHADALEVCCLDRLDACVTTAMAAGGLAVILGRRGGRS
jgi:hypothetical protein